MVEELLVFWTVYRWWLVLAALPLLLLIPLFWWRRRISPQQAARFFAWAEPLIPVPIYLLLALQWWPAAPIVDVRLRWVSVLFILLMVAITAYRLWRRRPVTPSSLPLRWAGAILVLILVPFMILLLLYGYQSRGEYGEQSAQNERPNLVFHSPYIEGDTSGPNWVLSGTTELGPTRQGDRALLTAGGELLSHPIWVQPGRHYDYGIDIFGSTTSPRAAQVQVRMLWQDASLLRSIAWNDSPPAMVIDCRIPLCPRTEFLHGSGVAPPQAAYLRLGIRQLAGRSAYENIMVTTDGVRVELYPDARRAALAFSFDWETAMGGPGHSKGAASHDVAEATRRGLAMRRGTDFLLELFATHQISATFYATGYNLLDGNTARRQFAGNPTYTWAKPKWGWPTDYWTTHPWYSDDPFGTVATDPAWYFGDQADVLQAAGHEIASHTFGHLYVRGSNPAELETDLAEWDRAAQARGLPPARSFAFPWQSSNSLTRDFDAVFLAHGINSYTRLYPGDVRDRYALGAIAREVTPPPAADVALSVMPDFLLGQGVAADAGDAVITDTLGTGLDEGQGTAGGAEAGRWVIDTVLARRGVTSLWNHPEALADDGPTRATWRETVEYAAQQRQNGLWIAPVSTIVDYMRAMRQVEVVWRATEGGYEALVTNHTEQALDGVTLSFPILVNSATVEGQPAPPVAEYADGHQVVLPRLAAGATMTVQARNLGK